MTTTLDVGKLRTTLAQICEQLQDLKTLRQEPHQPRWTFKEQQAFIRLKMEATTLYVIRAANRGRKHLTKVNLPYAGFYTVEDFEKHARDVAEKSYQREELQAKAEAVG